MDRELKGILADIIGMSACAGLAMETGIVWWWAGVAFFLYCFLRGD